MPVPQLPLSTYRLQFNGHLTFARAAELVPYLADLGISDCYTSPYFQASPGSLHGYDVVDPTRLNEEVGSADDYRTFVRALHAHGMGQILDIIPNHMHVAGPWNPWWQDVLEHGPASRYAHFFDIDWTPVKHELKGKILLPILGDHYGVTLENGELSLEYQAGRFVVRYHEYQLPIDPSLYAMILNHRLDALRDSRDGAPSVRALHDIISAFRRLPDRYRTDPEGVATRHREHAIIQRRLATLTEQRPDVRAFVQETLRTFNGTGGDPSGFDLLDALLRDQVYRLAFWRVAGEEINYRRFFDVTHLAALRIEDPEVFERVHRHACSLIPTAAVHGLRIDHVDGLYDPTRYLERWQAWARNELGWPADAKGRSLFLVVEKILGKGETLPEDWPVYGTTGYDFLDLLNHLFVDSHHQRAMDACYAEFTRETAAFDTLTHECKTLIMDAAMASELNALGHQLNRLSEQHRRSRDFTLNDLTHALKEIIACFPVYRTYVSPDGRAPVTDRDRAYLRLAVIQAKRNNPAAPGHVFDFIRNLLLKSADPTPSWDKVQSFVTKFQQTTGPVTAKGVEDTALYRYHRLVSLNEVGGDPARFGVPVATFHERMQTRQRQWPLSFSATSTHDTKRSEDVRARIHVLSELPHEWNTRVRRWHRLNNRHKRRLDGRDVPSRNEEYLLYQTLVGAWPFAGLDSGRYQDFRRRVQAYMLKALREAKRHTSWITPHAAYEDAVRRFIHHVLEPSPSNRFLADFLPFQKIIARYGAYNALSQVVLKIGCPGTPDFYQGTEIWNFTLVDPDNRQPVDYDHVRDVARRLPAEGTVTAAQLQHMLGSYEDGRVKLYVTRALLNYRKAHPALFQRGAYEPLETGGIHRRRLCAFQRTWNAESAIVVVPRLIYGMIPDPTVPVLGRDAWRDTRVLLPNGIRTAHYRHVLTNQRISAHEHEGTAVLAVSEIFQQLPVAMMERTS